MKRWHRWTLLAIVVLGLPALVWTQVSTYPRYRLSGRNGTLATVNPSGQLAVTILPPTADAQSSSSDASTFPRVRLSDGTVENLVAVDTNGRLHITCPDCGGSTYLPQSGTSYVVFNTSGAATTLGISSNTQTLAGSAGTLNQLWCEVGTAPGAGNSYAFTIQQNSVDTTITCTISNTDVLCSDTSHSMTVVASDLLSIKVVATGTPALTGVSCQISGPGQSTITTNTTTNLTGLLAGNGTDVDAITTSAGIATYISDETGTGALVFGTSPSLSNPSLGTTQLTVTHTVSTGGTTANLLVCFDGSTGNVTTCATSAVGALGVAKTTQTSTQSVEVGTRGIGTCVSDNTVTVGNLLGVGTSTAGRCKDLGQTSSLAVSPLLQVVGRAMACSTCTAGNDITYQAYGPGIYGAKACFAMGMFSFGSNQTATWYSAPYSSGANASETVASGWSVPSGTTLTCTDLYAFVQTAPASGKSWAITPRSATTPGALTCTIADTATSCADTTHSFTITGGSAVTVQWLASNSPSSTGSLSWSMRCCY